MKIGILGSGIVAQTLAAGFLAHEHEVMLGTSHPQKLAAWTGNNNRVKLGSFSETAAFGEVIVLAVKGEAAADVIRLAGGEDTLKGKPVMDATNPIADVPPVNGVLKFFTNLDESLMERLQLTFPGIRFVKGFNSVGAARMVNPQFKRGRPTMFICGNDDSAKAQIKPLIEQLGWDIADMGRAESARAIEPLCMLWCIPGFAKNEWTHAFAMFHAG